MEKLINELHYKPRQYAGIKCATLKLVDDQKYLDMVLVNYHSDVLNNVVYHLSFFDLDGNFLESTKMIPLYDINLKTNAYYKINHLLVNKKAEYVQIIIDLLLFNDLTQIEKPQFFPIASLDFIELDLDRAPIKVQPKEVKEKNQADLKEKASTNPKEKLGGLEITIRLLHTINIILSFLFIFSSPLFFISGWIMNMTLWLFLVFLGLTIAFLFLIVFINNRKVKLIFNILLLICVSIALLTIIMSMASIMMRGVLYV